MSCMRYMRIMKQMKFMLKTPKALWILCYVLMQHKVLGLVEADLRFAIMTQGRD